MNTETLFSTRWAWWAGYSCQANMQMRDNSLPCYGLSLNSWSYCSLQLGYLHNQLSDLAIPFFPICFFFHYNWLFALYSILFMHSFCMYGCVYARITVLHGRVWLRAEMELWFIFTIHCSWRPQVIVHYFYRAFIKRHVLRILNVFTEQALVCVTGSFRDVKH